MFWVLWNHETPWIVMNPAASSHHSNNALVRGHLMSFESGHLKKLSPTLERSWSYKRFTERYVKFPRPSLPFSADPVMSRLQTGLRISRRWLLCHCQQRKPQTEPYLKTIISCLYGSISWRHPMAYVNLWNLYYHMHIAYYQLWTSNIMCQTDTPHNKGIFENWDFMHLVLSWQDSQQAPIFPVA